MMKRVSVLLGLVIVVTAFQVGCYRPYSVDGMVGAPIRVRGYIRTARDQAPKTTDFLVATLLEPHRRIGKKDPRWAAQSIEFIEHFIDYASDRLGSEIPMEQLLEEGGRLVNQLGCDDPIVCYCYSRCVFACKREDYAQLYPLLEVTARKLCKEGYPKIVSCRIPRDLAVTGHPKANDYARISVEESIQAFAEDEYMLNHREAWLRNVLNVFDSCSKWSENYLDELLWAIEANPRMPWYERQVLTGKYHYRKAWAYRGGSWAHTVTEEGWDGFRKHMPIAREYMTKAWEKEPTRLLAQLEMITIAGMGYGAEGETARLWFDRTIAVELDNMRAYEDLMFVTSPRWGGSHDAVKAFGKACLATECYTTLVPLYYLLAMERIKGDGRRQAPGWKGTEVPKRISRIVERYRNTKSCPIRDSWLSSLELASEWCQGNGRMAAELLQVLGDDLEQEPFRNYYYVKAVNTPGSPRLVALYNGQNKRKATKFTALPLTGKSAHRKASPSRSPVLQSSAGQPKQPEVGMLLDAVRELLGPPPGKMKIRGTHIWVYGDIEIESSDGKTVTSIRRS